MIYTFEESEVRILNGQDADIEGGYVYVTWQYEIEHGSEGFFLELTPTKVQERLNFGGRTFDLKNVKKLLMIDGVGLNDYFHIKCESVFFENDEVVLITFIIEGE